MSPPSLISVCALIGVMIDTVLADLSELDQK